MNFSQRSGIYGPFSFDRGPVRRYWMTGVAVVFSLLTVCTAISTWGLSLLALPPILALHWLWLELVFRRLHYEVDEDSVNIRQGVVMHIEKVIPLEKITDIKLVQGPLMRLFGVYIVMIQTAGSRGQLPEGIMTFESHAKAVDVRERIMTARQQFRAGLLAAGGGDE